jgi:hypothetical protein
VWQLRNSGERLSLTLRPRPRLRLVPPIEEPLPDAEITRVPEREASAA